MIDPPGRRPKRTSIDPASMEAGSIARQTGSDDRYFAIPEDVLTLIVRSMVDRLPEPDRSCVQMTVMHRLSYAEAGRLLAPWLGRNKPIDGRTVWRWAKRGVASLQAALEESPWAADMLVDRVPVRHEPPSQQDTRAFHDVLTGETGDDADAVHHDTADGDGPDGGPAV